MFKQTIYILIAILTPFSAAALPDEADFGIAPNFPQPAPGSFSVVGTATPDGRYLLWNGDDVYRQKVAGGDKLDVIASGYLGDPAFMALNPTGDTALLGQGFGNGVDANLYLIDLDAPTDFNSGSEIVVVNHFSGVFLTDSLVAIDRGDFGFPAEIVVIDLLARSHAGRAPVHVLSIPSPPSGRASEITKPPGSFSASLAVNGGLLYVADAGNGQYKSFAVADVINAFQTSTPLAWVSGTDIGTPFQYPLGGVSGFTATGNLVIAGFGSIVEVNPGTGAVVQTLDPAGTGPFYGIIYNGPLGELVAIEFPAVFGDPLIFHSSSGALTALPAQSALALGLMAALLGWMGFLFVQRRLSQTKGARTTVFVPKDN